MAHKNNIEPWLTRKNKELSTKLIHTKRPDTLHDSDPAEALKTCYINFLKIPIKDTKPKQINTSQDLAQIHKCKSMLIHTHTDIYLYMLNHFIVI